MVDRNRRQFVRRAAMALAAAPLGMAGAVDERARTSREMRAISDAVDWLDAPRLTAETLLGKVVLVDFCTYTCINWLRTLPHVRAWAARYKASGLVVIGVHAPEFTFERRVDHVRRALGGMRLDHPIVLDNDHVIWRAFRNQYWPALYFIDARGRVRDHHFGEGEYERSERLIQRLLTESGAVGFPRDLVSVEARGVEVPADWGNLRSPENYLGYARTTHFASPGGVESDRRHVYAAPTRLALNQWALAGEWTVGSEATVLNKPGGRVVTRVHARDVHLVMGPGARGASIRIRVSIDGRPPGAAHGLDVDADGAGVVSEPRLYQLIRQPSPIVDRDVAIEFLESGAETFAFTFG